MKRIIIAGATGLVGSHLLALSGQYEEVHVLARGDVVDLPGNAVVHKIDLTTEFDTSGLPGQIDGVIVLSQSPDFRDFPDKALAIFDVNVRALLILLDYARRAGATHFVSASSGGVYGLSNDAMREDVVIPASGSLGFYPSTKIIGEILAHNYAAFMNVAVLRIFFAYGSGQKRSMLIPRLVDNVREGRPITIDGEDGLRINPVHATDAAKAVIAALSIDGSATFNVGGPDVLSLREIAEMIGQAVGRTPVFETNADKPAVSVVGDIARMKQELLKPARKLADHLDEML
ncbi:NAD(P)-dependent oxidoreductase [Sphingorhabdus soli]|uniref:NAD(P)-dependent oxidoreductase n=1 Tax=Flavisphingopyxis soli TaxID=2601267 RepID=A0A5C6UU87_9SPHN|nr:NAD(P)-dependent oxidoreductase [Sphingorhabdus soli]TXC74245.1 NAD(P)-dependent oxidoreductase [Sphingorhabdus soli]